MTVNNEHLHVSQSYGYTAGAQVAEAAYFTSEAAAVVDAAGYFNDAAAVLPVGSLLRVAWGIGGTAGGSNYVITANDGTTVTHTKMT